ncbi:MAG: PRC-barrel domain-containing protein [Candidatus Magasanikbacteria bacterium]
MLTPVKKIISLPVYTQSGQKLGRVVDVNLDIDNHVVIHYVVESGIVKKNIFLVSPSQVVSITSKRMNIVDAIIKELNFDVKVNKVFSPQTLNNLVTFEKN